MTKESAGYFSVNHASMAGKQSFFGQLWKEYSFSDSRYLTSDPFVLCMETVTAVRLTHAPASPSPFSIKTVDTDESTHSSSGGPSPSSSLP